MSPVEAHARIDKLATAFRWVVVVLAISLVASVGGVLYESYQGRKALTLDVRLGCVRAKSRDAMAALGWRTAEHRALSQGQPGFAATYARIADTMTRFARRDCAAEFPDPSPWPWSQPNP